MHKPYHCDECDGDGVAECPHCGQEEECHQCDGTGYDLDLVDVDRLKKRERAMMLSHKAGSCEWVKEDVAVGRMTLGRTCRIAYRDFLLPGKEPPFADDSKTHILAPGQQSLFEESQRESVRKGKT